MRVPQGGPAEERQGAQGAGEAGQVGPAGLLGVDEDGGPHRDDHRQPVHRYRDAHAHPADGGGHEQEGADEGQAAGEAQPQGPAVGRGGGGEPPCTRLAPAAMM